MVNRTMPDENMIPRNTMSRNLHRLHWTAALMLLSTAAIATAEPAESRQTFTSAAYGYSVTFPGDWKRIPDQDVQRGVALVHKNPAARNVVWEAAYQSPGGTIAFSYPYVVLQVTAYAGGREPSESQIKDTVKKMTGDRMREFAAHTGDATIDRAIANASIGDAQYDPANHILYQPLSMSAPGLGLIKGVIIGHFGRSAVAWVMCYDRAGHFDSSRPTFDQIAASFQFDKSAAFDPNQHSLNPFEIGAMDGIVVALVAGVLIHFIYRKRKRA
jgi:hypothetical protein